MYCLRYWARYVRKGEVKSERERVPRLSPKIVLCNSFLYTNNIQKYYSNSPCVISIIIVIAPTDTIRHSMVGDTQTNPQFCLVYDVTNGYLRSERKKHKPWDLIFY